MNLYLHEEDLEINLLYEATQNLKIDRSSLNRSRPETNLLTGQSPTTRPPPPLRLMVEILNGPIYDILPLFLGFRYTRSCRISTMNCLGPHKRFGVLWASFGGAMFFSLDRKKLSPRLSYINYSHKNSA